MISKSVKISVAIKNRNWTAPANTRCKLLWGEFDRNRKFHSLFPNRKKLKVINIDVAFRNEKEGNENTVKTFQKQGKITEEKISTYVKNGDNKRITNLCMELIEHIKRKDFILVERKLLFGLSIAKNAIEISQLINVLSKTKITNSIKTMHRKLIEKCVKDFDNIPVRSISLILNSMIKLNYYHSDFIILFWKDKERIIGRSNDVDICILYHFYVNNFQKFSFFKSEQDDTLHLILRRIYKDAYVFQMHGVATIMRCNKKLIKGYFNLLSGENKRDVGTHTDTYWSKGNGNTYRCINREIIDKINSKLKDRFFVKMAEASVQQLCNLLEDFEFFDLIDSQCYYNVLELLREKKSSENFKILDFLNILNLIKSRNIKYNNNMFSVCNFNFVFNELKNKNFEEISVNDLSELIKIIYYFKKIYHINFCMHKMENSLNRKELNDVKSVRTLIYLLYDLITIRKTDKTQKQLIEKLFTCIRSRLNGKIHNSSGIFEKNGFVWKDKNEIEEDKYEEVSTSEALLFVSSLHKLIENRVMYRRGLGLVSIDKENLTDESLTEKKDLIETFILKSCLYNWKCSLHEQDKLIHLFLYKMFLLGSIRSEKVFLFWNILKQSLILSIYFNISEIVLFLKAVSNCSYWIDRTNFFIFEKMLNYVSVLILAQSEELRKRGELKKNEWKLNISPEEMELLIKGSIASDNTNLNYINNIFKEINQIIEMNYVYLSETSLMIENEKEKKKDENVTYDYNHPRIHGEHCVQILFYFYKLSYINNDIIKIVFKNLHNNLEFLNANQIVKVVSGLSILKNIDKEFHLFHSLMHKLVAKFVSFFKEGEIKNGIINKTDEMIKFFYFFSKLSISLNLKNAILRKHVLLLLEKILKKEKLHLKNLQLLLNGFKNLYPYRYKNLLVSILKQLKHNHVCKLHVGAKSEQEEEKREGYYKSEKEDTEGVVETENTVTLSFLKTYFSLLPLLINIVSNVELELNTLYLEVSKCLFKQLYYMVRHDDKAMQEIIPDVITFINLSFKCNDLLEMFKTFINYIFDMKDLIPKEQFCIFLLNLQFDIDRLFPKEECTILKIKKETFFIKIQIYLKDFSIGGGHGQNIFSDSYLKGEDIKEKGYDFSFNQKKLTFLDTEEDDERDVSSVEYNFIHVHSLHKGSIPSQMTIEGGMETKMKGERENANGSRKETEKEHKIEGKGSKKSSLHEFDIILKKYIHCQNTEEDKLELLTNQKILNFFIKYIDLKKKIIFEFLEEKDYFKELDDTSIELLPLVNIRLYMLSKLKFKLFLMPFYEWQNCLSRVEKAKLIYRKLLNVSSEENFYSNETKKANVYYSIGEYA